MVHNFEPVGVSRNNVSVACNIVAVEDVTSRAMAPHYFAVETEVKDIASAAWQNLVSHFLKF